MKNKLLPIIVGFLLLMNVSHAQSKTVQQNASQPKDDAVDVRFQTLKRICWYMKLWFFAAS